MDDVVLNKVAALERCLNMIREEGTKDWKSNFTYQDALLLNLERACQVCIDLSAHIVRKKALGLPKFSRELFDLLEASEIIDNSMAVEMKKMVGFRNLIVHEYGTLNLNIIESILNSKLNVFEEFGSLMIKKSNG
ncbi:type VII toxin-antitoxin system HepT family RNase toxin [Ekhidna sp.]|uniref:type VII toxin-antitoxin system HepT family RNase toxin n=1 Tax=Ekhidna sp. TaxID=2608089 RepID=UPI003CCBE65C